MVEAQQMQNRGVQIVDVDAILDRVEAKLIGRAVHVSAADAAAGEPRREAPMIVIAADVVKPLITGNEMNSTRNPAQIDELGPYVLQT